MANPGPLRQQREFHLQGLACQANRLCHLIPAASMFSSGPAPPLGFLGLGSWLLPGSRPSGIFLRRFTESRVLMNCWVAASGDSRCDAPGFSIIALDPLGQAAGGIWLAWIFPASSRLQSLSYGGISMPMQQLGFGRRASWKSLARRAGANTEVQGAPKIQEKVTALEPAGCHYNSLSVFPCQIHHREVMAAVRQAESMLGAVESGLDRLESSLDGLTAQIVALTAALNLIKGWIVGLRTLSLALNSPTSSRAALST